MENEILKNNQVAIMGEISSAFTYSHEIFGEKFYTADIKVQRLSGSFDMVKMMVSDRLLDVSEDYVGALVEVFGQFRSYNMRDIERNHVLLLVFVREMRFLEVIDKKAKTNQIFLDGHICKNPVFRTTPNGREIADLFIAVNRPYNKSDYIPCIAWGRDARYISRLKVGTHIQLDGRIQSREYTKYFDGETQETRTAYEVSVSRIDVIEESEESTNESRSEENM